MKRLCLIFCSLLSTCAWADVTAINQKGQAVNIDSQLVPNRENIVVFHHKATYLSHQLYQSLTKYSLTHKDVPILIVDISRPDCPAAKQHHVQTFPYVRIYDIKGQLKSEGPPAYKTVLQMTKE